MKSFFSDIGIAVILTIGFVATTLFLHHAHLLIHDN